MPEIVKRHECEKRAPVIGQTDQIKSDDDVYLAPDPFRLLRKFFLDAFVDFANVVAEITVKSIRPRTFRFAVLAVSIDRQRIDRGSVRTNAIHVADVMAQMNVVVELLREAVGHGKNDAVDPVQHRRGEERVVDEIVTRGIDAPRNADRIDQRERNPYRPRNRVKTEKQRRHENEMTQTH